MSVRLHQRFLAASVTYEEKHDGMFNRVFAFSDGKEIGKITTQRYEQLVFEVHTEPLGPCAVITGLYVDPDFGTSEYKIGTELFLRMKEMEARGGRSLIHDWILSDGAWGWINTLPRPQWKAKVDPDGDVGTVEVVDGLP
jgi:hypothetical protein